MIPQPLTGRKILDLSQYIAGPTCGQLLADFGAEVVKVEPPAGDPSRSLGATRHGSIYFRHFNTGKRSVRLDLSTDGGRDELDKMMRTADALVMNFSAATVRKLGLDWERLHPRHPHLIVTSITAYGNDDPRTALDAVIQAVSGFARLNADENGQPRITAGYPTDLFSGMFAALSTSMALLEPERAEGVLIDVPMIEVAMAAMCGPSILASAAGEPAFTARGNRDTATAPSSIFACTDGSVYIYAGLDKHWERLRPVVDGPEGSHEDRVAQPEHYEAAVEAWTCERPLVQVLEQMRALGIAAAPVDDLAGALTALREQRFGAAVRFAGDEPVPQFPVTFSGERTPRTPAPIEEER